MGTRDDDDDWTGTPPEGRHPRSTSNAGFWRNQRQAIYAMSLLGVFVICAIVLVLLLG